VQEGVLEGSKSSFMLLDERSGADRKQFGNCGDEMSSERSLLEISDKGCRGYEREDGSV
jgi:hypothetical protein